MKLKKQLQHLMAIVFALMLVLPVMAQNSKKPAPPKPKANSQLQSKNKIYDVVEVLPAFPGGNKAMGDYINKNVKYPKIDRENNVQGKVMAQFVVERDGSLTNIKAVRSPSQSMADEAIRVLKSSPKWKPGINNGKPVRSTFTMPVSFTLGEG